MINGVYPSQFGAVEEMRTSHYRNLNRIINKSKTNLSWLPENVMIATRHRKTNHENWRSFTRKVQDQQQTKRNSHIYEKLKKIADSSSSYRYKTQSNYDPLLHHNYLYECQKRYTKIEKNNQIISSKILNVKGTLNHSRDELRFKNNKLQVSRLEKFNQLKRLNKIVCRSLNKRFHTTSSRFSCSRIMNNHNNNPEIPSFSSSQNK